MRTSIIYGSTSRARYAACYRINGYASNETIADHGVVNIQEHEVDVRRSLFAIGR